MDWDRRVDAASLVVLRIAVGLLLFVSAVRFVARGWVQELLLAPSVHFHYWGFGWVGEPSAWLAYSLFFVLAASSIALAAGLATRTSALIALVCFGWIELIDLTYYLNHYYFLTCLLATFVLVPPRPEHDGKVPAWKLALMRTQVALVYVYAGLAKLGGDWLLHAQPLDIWLARHADLPIVGRFLDEAWVAYAASWAGAGFDLLIVPALLWPRTRAWAYAALVGFHLVTGLLFPIGMFPYFMIAAATILFPPDWPHARGNRPYSAFGLRAGSLRVPRADGPRRWLAAGAVLDRPVRINPELERSLGVVAAVSIAVQLALPWRSLLYPGSTLWHEQGSRFSYRVMLVEKAGLIEYRVRDRKSGREWRVDPADELTRLQARMLATQPDFILQYAHHLAAKYEQQLPGSAIEVRADVFVSLHGRPARRLIDPDVDLAREHDTLAPKPWILPGPEEPPP